MVSVPASVLARYRRVTRYNSPYRAHDRGRAVDLYPGIDVAPSPVAGEVVTTRTVACPGRHYAVDEDHLLVVATDPDSYARGHLARILHVDPTVEPGDRVAVGDPLGETVRSGFFGQWVADHLHLGFRPRDADPVRASGSLPVTLDVDVEPVPWDGVGTVVDTGPTYARLDAPAHPDPTSEPSAPGDDDGNVPDPPVPDDVRWVALASYEGVALDGGLAHYSGGGALTGTTGPVSLLGCEVGHPAPVAGDGVQSAGVAGDSAADAPAKDGGPTRDLDWTDVGVFADGVRATGLSLFASRVDFGAKLVFHEGHGFAVGDEVSVSIRPVEDRIRLD